MSFRAEVNLAGVLMDCLECNFELSRETNAKGQAASGVYGGRINMVVESTADTTIIEKMVNNQFTPTEGSVTFKKPDEDATMKVLEFTNSYIVHFKEVLNVNDSTPMTIHFTVSAETITMGDATHDNRWSS